MTRILIAEDDYFLAKIFRERLVEAGYAVTAVNDGLSAIEHLTESTPHAILLDLSLPGLDGVGVLHFIRTRPRLQHIPVVVVSNSPYFSGEVQAAWKAGATSFLNKADFSPQQLLDALDKVLAEPSGETKAPSPEPPARPSVSRFRRPVEEKPPEVLVADDDRLIHGVLKFFLEQAGFTVRSAYDGRQALEAAIFSAPDLLILDGMMPGMDGFVVAEHWSMHPRLSTVPVIMLTGVDDAEKRSRMDDCGIVRYLTKPFSPEALVKIAIESVESSGA